MISQKDIFGNANFVFRASQTFSRNKFLGLLSRCMKEGVADWPSPGKQLDDVTGRRINLRKGAQYSFYSLKITNFAILGDPPLLKLEYLKIDYLQKAESFLRSEYLDWPYY